ncbi:MAG: four-carbon acid sugar kinase family protein [Desulfarculus sp.]|nr:MAG: four-carbon acid sugar kinase family protein [Desulfarculus sp.]
MAILLGAIGDDFTGSTDLALMLGKHGMPAVQYLGVPAGQPAPAGAQAAVVALKSRTAPVQQAVAQSLAACGWLLAQGARQIFFKYCSTFDSTAQGNIGPVAAALLERLGAGQTIFCPAFPANGRTVYQGHLFVGSALLSESGMRHHPLTPMTDPNLVRFLGRQLPAHSRAGLLPHALVRQGHQALAAALAELEGQGTRYVVVDALTDQDLMEIGRACAGLRLITGGSGVAMGLPENFRRAGLLPAGGGLEPLPALPGGAAVLAGSCSEATRGQVAAMAQAWPSLRLDPLALAAGGQGAEQAAAWAGEHLARGPALIYSSAGPEEVGRAQEGLGRARAGELVEAAFARIARALREAGVAKFIVAGGETSGAVLEALGVRALRIGPEIDPGVPWTFSLGEPTLCLALKSGNFGGRDFFAKALGMLP